MVMIAMMTRMVSDDYDDFLVLDTHLVPNKPEVIPEISVRTELGDKTQRTATCHATQHADDIQMFANFFHQRYLCNKVTPIFQVCVRW